MKIYFVTGNKRKLEEAQAIIPELQQLDFDLPEIQEMDEQKIIAAKLVATFAHHPGPFVVEDSSLSFEALHGLPGPFIRWFMESMGLPGLAEMTLKLGNQRARSTVTIGYAQDINNIHYFSADIEGTIVAPRGKAEFGFDPIFIPDGFDRTFAEMSLEEKTSISHRAMAFRKLKEFLKRV